jgi:hypothetical protein
MRNALFHFSSRHANVCRETRERSRVNAHDRSKGDVLPAWQPIWADVMFDYGATDAAIAACEHGLVVMRDRDQLLASRRAMAITQWRGSHRKTFDGEWTHLEHLADVAEAELREMIHRLTIAISSARQEQRSREHQRAEWHRQKALEEEQARQKAITDEAKRVEEERLAKEKAKLRAHD